MASLSRWSLVALCLLSLAAGSTLRAPATSSGSLMDSFNQIYNATGTFPDDKDEYTQFAIVNQHFNACLAVLGRKVGNGGRVGLEGCYFSNVESPELFWLQHVGNGYVVLATPWNRCLGSGKQHGAPVWTGDWCDSPSHQFFLEVRGDVLLFAHRDSGHYLTASDIKEQVRTELYTTSGRQHWQVCEPSGQRCWPPQRTIATTPKTKEIVAPTPNTKEIISKQIVAPTPDTKEIISKELVEKVAVVPLAKRKVAWEEEEDEDELDETNPVEWSMDGQNSESRKN